MLIFHIQYLFCLFLSNISFVPTCICVKTRNTQFNWWFFWWRGNYCFLSEDLLNPVMEYQLCCADGVVCDTGQYQCSSGHCVASHLVCDNVPNCRDGSDEDWRAGCFSMGNWFCSCFLCSFIQHQCYYCAVMVIRFFWCWPYILMLMQ